jgi:hypothetical protein
MTDDELRQYCRRVVSMAMQQEQPDASLLAEAVLRLAEDVLWLLDEINKLRGKRKRHKRKRQKPIHVPCAGGCGRAAYIRPNKVEPCEGYLCNLGRCSFNADFKIPPPPPGHHLCTLMNAAGGFSGWRYELDTSEHEAAVERAKDILARGLEQLTKLN